jgi:hypothetical protein
MAKIGKLELVLAREAGLFRNAVPELKHGFRSVVQPGVSRMSTCSRASAVAVLCCLFIGCGESTEPEVQVGAYEVEINPGSIVDDTIGTLLSDPLIVRLKRGGRAVAGAEVRLQVESYYPQGVIRPFGTVWLRANGQRNLVDAVLVTDRNGEIAVGVTLGERVGGGLVRIDVPSANLRDSVLYSIRPGQPVEGSIEPGDTAIYVGASYKLRARLFDRARNLREDVPLVVTSGDVVSVTSQGAVQANKVGRTSVTASVMGLSRLIGVSVVPKATFSASVRGVQSLGRSRIVTFNADGSNLRDLRPLTPPLQDANGAWSPSTREFAFESGDSYYRLYVKNSDGGIRRLVSNSEDLDQETSASYSRDGSMIYFRGAWQGRWDIWRVPSAGGKAELLLRGNGFAYDIGRLSPSPDGKSLVFNIRDQLGGLRILDLVTREVRTLHSQGTEPRWSPDGQWIAFSNYENLSRIRPDGTGLEVISRSTGGLGTGLAWSPDGEWLISQAEFSLLLNLVRVSDGLVIPLPYTMGFHHPDWSY